MSSSHRRRSRLDHLEYTGGNLRFLSAILDIVPKPDPPKVLEIGCGTGLLAQFLAAVLPVEVVGTEMSSDAASAARRRIPCLHVPDGTIPEKPREFGLVYCKDVLPMVDDKHAFVRRVREILAAGGSFVTYMPNAADFDQKPLYRFIPGSRGESQESYGDVDQFLRQLRNSGFRHVHSERLVLGPLRLDDRYVLKHLDGFFSNTDKEPYENVRLKGLSKLMNRVLCLEEHGIGVHYEWERTLIVAKK